MPTLELDLSTARSRRLTFVRARITT